MFVIAFYSPDTVLHVVIHSLQCSWIHMLLSDSLHSSVSAVAVIRGSCLQRRAAFLNGFDELIYGCILVPAFPTRWPTMHVLVRFNLSCPSTWRLLGYGCYFTLEKKRQRC